MIIAIDGHSACGKSTLARDLAHALGFLYIDSGAMYRAVTLYFRSKNILPTDSESISKQIDLIHIHFEKTESSHLILNNQDVSETIRSSEINDWVSDYATIPIVRKRMVELQRNLSADSDVVMDGRDIGSVVFPQAEVKFFVTADIETRTQRRFIELQERGIHADYQSVKINLLKRDQIDSTRLDSPLIQCVDAVVIDNSRMTRSEQLQVALDTIRGKQILK
ncbi:MAG: (d)CMP kinase [Saprospiraceae bacterium]|nr:(d)CMP kinase [Saprospiraceae bacterium]